MTDNQGWTLGTPAAVAPPREEMITGWTDGLGRTFGGLREAGLIEVGTLIQVEGEVYLMGDINTMGGACDDCPDVLHTDIVERFKQVWRDHA